MELSCESCDTNFLRARTLSVGAIGKLFGLCWGTPLAAAHGETMSKAAQMKHRLKEQIRLILLSNHYPQ
jgi:hypothetical protein